MGPTLGLTHYYLSEGRGDDPLHEMADPIMKSKNSWYRKKVKKGKGRVLAIALLTRELVTRSALQSREWQLIGMS